MLAQLKVDYEPSKSTAVFFIIVPWTKWSEIQGVIRQIWPLLYRRMFSAVHAVYGLISSLIDCINSKSVSLALSEHFE